MTAPPIDLLAHNFNVGGSGFGVTPQQEDFITRLKNAPPSPLVGQSFMHELAREGDVLSAEVIIAAGGDVDLPDDEGRRPLHEAASSGRLEMIKLILKHGAILDAPIAPFGYTALYLAVQQSQYETVRFLIERGARVDVKDALSGEGLLHIAASRGDMQMTGILIAAGACVFAEDRKGQTPRDHAARKYRKDLEKVLLKVMQHHALQGI